MTFESIYNTAAEVINGMERSGYMFAPDTTVCVIVSSSGRVYSGVSGMAADMNGMTVAVHAEINAVNNMTALGEFAVDTLIILNAAGRAPMLPCGGCIGYIMSVNPSNANAYAAMPDRMIRLADVSAFAQGNVPLAAAPVPPRPVLNSVAAPCGSSSGDLLKGRINDLISDDDDEDDEEDEQYLEEFGKPKKKKFFGLF